VDQKRSSDRKPSHARQSLHGATLLRLISQKVLNLIRLNFLMSGPRLIRDVFALAFVGSVEVNIALLLYDMQRGIPAMVGENSLGMLHVNFLIAVVGLRAILEEVTC
jgi:hypothetical protein